SGQQLTERAVEAAKRAALPAIDLAFVQGRLALVLFYKGQTAEALRLLQKNLALISATYGDDHLRVAPELLNLAAAYRLSGNAARALPLSRRASHLYRKSHVPEVWEATSDMEGGLEALQTGQPRLAANLLGHALKIMGPSLSPATSVPLRFHLA